MKTLYRELGGGVVLLLLAAVLYWAAVTTARPVRHVRGMPIDVLGEMGYPTALAVVLGLCGAALVAITLLRMGGWLPEAAPEALPTLPSGQHRSWMLILATGAFVFCLPFVGYLIAMPLFLIAGTMIAGYRRFAVTLAFALLFTFATHAGFERGLGVRLPPVPIF